MSRVATVLAVGLLCLSTAQPSAATPGELDPTFAGDGTLTTSFSSTRTRNETARAVVVQPDGKVLVAGTADVEEGRPSRDFGLVRYNQDGTLDSAFGTGGRVTTDFTGGVDEAFDLVLQPDGKIIAAGSTSAAGRPAGDGVSDFAVVRYLSNGTPDESFGIDGRAGADFQGVGERVLAMALGLDGRIVVAGYADYLQIGAARFTTDGVLDPSFGADGMVEPPLGNAIYAARGVGIQTDGRIVIGGSSCNLTKCFFSTTLLRLNADGGSDASFMFRGGVTEGANDLTVLADGRIVLAGDGREKIARLSADGSIDGGFGCNGSALGGEYFNPQVLAVRNDALAVASGVRSTRSDTSDFKVVRYSAAGVLDKAFGGNEGVVTDLGGADLPRDVAIAPDGRVVVAGVSSQPDTGSAFAVARYLGGAVEDALPDCQSPTISVNGVPRTGCTRRNFVARVRIRDRSSLRRVGVGVDGLYQREGRSGRFRQAVDVHGLRPGTHHLNVFASDFFGTQRRVSVAFRRCGPRGAVRR